MADSDFVWYRCPYCRFLCLTPHDLALHLKAYGNVPHTRLVECTRILFEVEGHKKGVDDHGEWSWRDSSSLHPSIVKSCRRLLDERFHAEK